MSARDIYQEDLSESDVAFIIVAIIYVVGSFFYIIGNNNNYFERQDKYAVPAKKTNVINVNVNASVKLPEDAVVGGGMDLALDQEIVDQLKQDVLTQGLALMETKLGYEFTKFMENKQTKPPLKEDEYRYHRYIFMGSTSLFILLFAFMRLHRLIPIFLIELFERKEQELDSGLKRQLTMLTKDVKKIHKFFENPN